MMTRSTRLSAVAALALLAGCDLPFVTACTAEARPAIVVEIVDAQTGVVLEGLEGLRVIAREGAYADTARFPGSLTGLAYERAGTYTVTVEHPDYLPWSRSGVRVREDGCNHVRTESITARFQRAP
jgi:hypothetical protein